MLILYIYLRYKIKEKESDFFAWKKSYELHRIVIELFDKDLRNVDDRMFKSQLLHKNENNSDNT